jgi:hypothetical protein
MRASILALAMLLAVAVRPSAMAMRLFPGAGVAEPTGGSASWGVQLAADGALSVTALAASDEGADGGRGRGRGP